MTDLNAENPDAADIVGPNGEDASDALLGSGKEYYPTLDEEDTAILEVNFKPRENPINVGPFNFTTQGELTVITDLFSPEGEKIATQEVRTCIP